MRIDHNFFLKRYLVFIFVILSPFVLSFILPLFLLGNRYSVFEIGGAFASISQKDLINISPIIFLIFSSYLSIFYYRKFYNEHVNSSSFNKNIINIFIFVSTISLFYHLNNFIKYPNFIVQIFIPLTYLPIISLAVLRDKISTKKKFFYIVIAVDFFLSLSLNSFTRDIITKILILILCIDFEKIKLKNVIALFLFLFLIFFFKDLLRKNFIEIGSVSISDYSIDQKLAEEYKKKLDADNFLITNQFIFKKTKEVKLYEKYKDYFKRLNKNENSYLDELYHENFFDIYSLCSVRDINCLTFRDFYKRIINISIKKTQNNIQKENFSLVKPIDRFNKVSNFIFYYQFFNKKNNLFLKNELYYPQIFSAVPIPRFIWKSKPINENGYIIGEFFDFNTSKSGFNAWYEPLVIELFISYGLLGLVFYLLINFSTIYTISRISFTINNLYKTIFFVGILRFYFDYHVQGLVESIGGLIYFLTVLFIIERVLNFIRKEYWLRG